MKIFVTSITTEKELHKLQLLFFNFRFIKIVKSLFYLFHIILIVLRVKLNTISFPTPNLTLKSKTARKYVKTDNGTVSISAWTCGKSALNLNYVSLRPSATCGKSAPNSRGENPSDAIWICGKPVLR